jgi:transposase
MTERVRVREIDDDEGRRLLRIVRRGSASVVTWRRAQMILLSAQGMHAARIAQVTFTSPDRLRDVIHNFNTDGFDSLYPRYRGGRPPTFTLPQRREMKKIAKSKPAEHDLPFSTWSLAKLADFLVAEGVVDDISIERLREILRAEGVSSQRIKTWKTSRELPSVPRTSGVRWSAASRKDVVYACTTPCRVPAAGRCVGPGRGQTGCRPHRILRDLPDRPVPTPAHLDDLRLELRRERPTRPT